MTVDQKVELELKGRLALQVTRRGVRRALLNGEAYDPDGKGKAYWEAQEAAIKG